jgi:hypothetical protein
MVSTIAITPTDVNSSHLHAQQRRTKDKQRHGGEDYLDAGANRRSDGQINFIGARSGWCRRPELIDMKTVI